MQTVDIALIACSVVFGATTMFGALLKSRKAMVTGTALLVVAALVSCFV